MKRNTLIGLAVLIVVAAGVVFFGMRMQAPASAVKTGLIASASYACSDSKVIGAEYYSGEDKPSPGPDLPPVPGGSVLLTLSDGRAMTLHQTISGSGVRYANPDESIVFWNKGNGATFTENGAQTYMGCIEVAKDPGGLPLAYENGTEGFSLRYPTGYSVDASYRYQELGPGKDIGGIKFTIPASTVAGTNLSADSYISVEELPQTAECTADLFLDQGVKAQNVDEDGTTYSVASSTGAGAGNRYEETVYAMPGTNPCMAVRYFIHYGAIQNYPEGAVKEFDHRALVAQFDAIRKTIKIAQ